MPPQLRGYKMLTCSVVLLALLASAQGRAVNISNTWVLPEEGFPVFYRYFRDRISWYEADAVCQFHHANLVTVDTTAQYDAVRAYLKELDISSAVWVGLIRSNPDGDFTWTDYRGLSGDGYWSSAPDARAAPLCAAADPAADYRWEARACGGPTVASFICELPVPHWALGNEGCMVRALPALTVLYLPESAAVQLTADCGLAGVKSVQCTGNVKREDLLKNLSCNEDEELTSTPGISSEATSSGTESTVNITDLETITELITEEDIMTKHDIAPNKLATQGTPAPGVVQENLPTNQRTTINKLNNVYTQKNVNLDLIHNNNLQSNDIPKLANNNENFLTMEQSEKLEDEKHMHHKMLHDELARHGNFETIFSQPTDHFVPPLVMAKAKLSDDMTVLSLAEKHAQQLAEQRFAKHNLLDNHDILKSFYKSTTEVPNKFEIVEKPLVMTVQSANNKDDVKKDKVKPKKYKEKSEDPKARNSKIDGKLFKLGKFTDSLTTDFTTKVTEPTTTSVSVTQNKVKQDAMELKVILKEPEATKITTNTQLEHNRTKSENIITTEKLSTDLVENTSTVDQLTTTPKPVVNVKIENHDTVAISDLDNKLAGTTTSTEKATPLTLNTIQNVAMQDIAMNHEIIKITIVKDADEVASTHTVFEITTLMPEFKDAITNDNKSDHSNTPQQNITPKEVISSENITTSVLSNTAQKETGTTSASELSTASGAVNMNTGSAIEDIQMLSTETPLITKIDSVTFTQTKNTKDIVKDSTEPSTTVDLVSTTKKSKIEIVNITEIFDGEQDKNSTEADVIDDLNSPLLSAANEPLHRPNRSRRPQPPNRQAKFNPFRILG